MFSGMKAELGTYIDASPSLRAHCPLIKELPTKARNVNHPHKNTAVRYHRVSFR